MSDSPFISADVQAIMPCIGCISNFEGDIEISAIYLRDTNWPGCPTHGQVGSGESYGDSWNKAQTESIFVECRVDFARPIKNRSAALVEAAALAAPFIRAHAIKMHAAYAAETARQGTIAEIFAAAMKGEAK